MFKHWTRAIFIGLGLVLTACSQNTFVILETDKGDIEIELYQDEAPISSADFLYYVDHELYNGQGFYRVVRPETDPLGLGMQIIQGGRLDGETVTPTVDHEPTSQSGLSNMPGMVSLARDTPGTGSAAYFFINISDNSFLDFGGERNPDGQGYAVFGKVVKGMDVVTSIQSGNANGPADAAVIKGQILTEPVIIKSARRK